ncbi:membrane protein insertion efficiency factor YidD [Mycolicibacterium hassiacum]|uniref:membrane protein insertion efficiency factor YidD n=1 Tax=Mycolicibacterium hassiacum TaxID=46351 RepID=UPI0009DA8F2B|nr:membrane protein insertion efficiency factor YidD [Mycolicibacterium hassiacum]MBX5489118.1 membrane protein insertion efficiency factor YidD [Mycolicibacterium hassiacum]PZN25020.1 MAG: membrane protein insertion efficiency factor YidD [Mycolicibacterium hassiacum]
MTTVRAAATRSVIFVIQLYRNMISPLRPPSCRFIPTCSQYAVEALTEFGLVRGGWLAVKRLLKCGPWHRGGWDPVPERCEPHDPCGGRPESESRSGSETRV